MSSKKYITTLILSSSLLLSSPAKAITMEELFRQAQNLAQQGQQAQNSPLGAQFADIANLATQVQGFMQYLQQIQQANGIGQITGSACQAAQSLLGDNQVTTFLCQINELAGKASKLMDKGQFETYGQRLLNEFATKAFGNIESLKDPNLGGKLRDNLMSSITDSLQSFQEQVDYTAKEGAKKTILGGSEGNNQEKTYVDTAVNEGLALAGAQGTGLTGAMYDKSYKAIQGEGQTLAIQNEGLASLDNITEAIKAANMITDEAAKKAASRRAEAENANSARKVMEVQVQATADMFEMLAAYQQANLTTMSNMAKLSSNTNNLVAMELQKIYNDQQAEVEAQRQELEAAVQENTEQVNQLKERLQAFETFYEENGDGKAIARINWGTIGQ